MDNLAYDYRLEEDFEIIEGVKFMAPAPSPTHGTIISILGMFFNNYIYTNDIKAFVFGDNTDVYLSENDHFKPDLSVVCNPKIIDWNKAIIGTPDLIVEVLSKSTMKRDMGLKKKTYAKYGVKEYWIVNPWAKSIEVYYLTEGDFELDEVYKVFNDAEWERLSDNERAESKFEIKVSVFDDLTIDVRNVFKWWIDE